MQHWTTSRGSRIVQVLKGRSNAYLIQTEGQNFLVDAGRKTKRSRLIKNLEKINPGTIQSLLLTHAHFDHAENAAFLKKKYEIKIAVHSEEKEFLEKGHNTQVWCIIPYLSFIVDLIIPFALKKYQFDPVDPEIIFSSSGKYPDLPASLEVLHTPGHSPGSVSILVDHEIALVGDLIFGVFAISSVPPFANNPLEMVKSWKKILDTKVNLILTGHGKPRTLKRFTRHYLEMKERWL